MFDMQEFALQGRTALVVGGSGGIGREIALGYRSAGATVLIAARDEARLSAVTAELDQRGPRFGYRVDARSTEDLARLAEAVERDHGAPSILVNCQGAIAIKPALELSEAEYDAILDTNLKSVFFACTTFGRRMIESGGGAIVNVSSLAAHSGWAGAAAYGASKMGVTGITQSFAAEWGDKGVRVNAIAPGFFLTDFNREKMSQERKAEARRRSALKRMGELNELVGAAIFLACDAARFVTGATLRVDGGFLASGI